MYASLADLFLQIQNMRPVFDEGPLDLPLENCVAFWLES